MRRIFWVAMVLAIPGMAQGAVPLVQAENEFAVDLYRQVSATPGNMVFSPYSAAAALGMAYVGARGETAREMAGILHLGGMSDAAFLQAVQAQAKDFNVEQSDGFTLHMANALWVEQGFALKPEFLAAVKTDCGGSARAVAFQNADDAAGEINNWVAAQTEGEIPSLVSPDMFNQYTRLVLTNAVYFKSGWEVDFETFETMMQAFHRPGETDETVPMMNQVKHFALSHQDGVQVLTVPYRHDLMSLVIVLPDKRDGLATVTAALTAPKLDGWIAAGQDTLVALTLPKFKTDTTVPLVPVLRSLGMKLPFDRHRADFSAMAHLPPDERLYVSDVLQKATITVNEKGTEAAAATAMTMAVAQAAPPPNFVPPIPFVADHPFLYFIRDNQSGAILFMGRVEDPAR